MGISVEYWNLFGDLQKGFDSIENEYSELQSQWEEWKSEGMSEDDLKQIKGCDLYNIEKEWVRSIMWILEEHLENFKIKKEKII